MRSFVIGSILVALAAGQYQQSTGQEMVHQMTPTDHGGAGHAAIPYGHTVYAQFIPIGQGSYYIEQLRMPSDAKATAQEQVADTKDHASFEVPDGHKLYGKMVTKQEAPWVASMSVVPVGAQMVGFNPLQGEPKYKYQRNTSQNGEENYIYDSLAVQDLIQEMTKLDHELQHEYVEYAGHEYRPAYEKHFEAHHETLNLDQKPEHHIQEKIHHFEKHEDPVGEANKKDSNLVIHSSGGEYTLLESPHHHHIQEHHQPIHLPELHHQSDVHHQMHETEEVKPHFDHIEHFVEGTLGGRRHVDTHIRSDEAIRHHLAQQHHIVEPVEPRKEHHHQAEIQSLEQLDEELLPMHYYEPHELNERGFDEEHSHRQLTDYHHEHHNPEHHNVYRGIHIKPIPFDHHDYVHNVPLF